MFTKTVTRLVAAPRRIQASSYAMFLKASKGSKVLAGLAAPARARALAKKWRALTVGEKRVFANKAKYVTFAVKPKSANAVPKVRKTRKASKYALFVKANYSKVKNLPFTKRLGAIAKLWHARK